MNSFQYLAPIASFRYAAPRDLDELLEALDHHGSEAKIISGGTDLTIALKQRSIEPHVIIDLSPLRSELSGISLKDKRLIIGAMTTYADLERDPLIKQYATALGIAASQVGTQQIRNLGTIGGNLANASPAADTAPPLIVMRAMIHLKSKKGGRILPVEEFFKGVKKTALAPNEIISSVEIPIEVSSSSYWMRLAKRNENVISVVSVAISSGLHGDFFGDSRISLGAVAPTPILARESSTILSGAKVTPEVIEKVAISARDESKPISDVRASAQYRKHIVYTLTKRVIMEIMEKEKRR